MIPLRGAVEQTAALPGVTGLARPHFWPNTSGQLVGTLHIEVKITHISHKP